MVYKTHTFLCGPQMTFWRHFPIANGSYFWIGACQWISYSQNQTEWFICESNLSGSHVQLTDSLSDYHWKNEVNFRQCYQMASEEFEYRCKDYFYDILWCFFKLESSCPFHRYFMEKENCEYIHKLCLPFCVPQKKESSLERHDIE